jgi:hypothetical protein
MGVNMNLVYIAGPYRAPYIEDVEKNIQRARRHHTFWIKEGFASICPHMNTSQMERVINEDNVILPMDVEIIKRCDILVLQGDWRSSSGSLIEKKAAEDAGLVILYEAKLGYIHTPYLYVRMSDYRTVYPCKRVLEEL